MTLPVGDSGRDPTTSRSTGPAAGLADPGAKRRSEAASGLRGRSVPFVDDANGIDADRGVRAQICGCDGDRRRAPEQQFVGGDPRLDRARSSAVLGAKDDHVGLFALGQFGQADAGAGVDDDVARHVRRPDRGRSAGQQLLRLFLLQRPALGVADVGERELGAGVGEQAAEGESVAVVVGVVVGNDDLQGHEAPP